MNQDNQVKNIIYKNYTSTSVEGAYQENSNRPDSLISIMRDYIVVLDDSSPTTEPMQEKSL